VIWDFSPVFGKADHFPLTAGYNTQQKINFIGLKTVRKFYKTLMWVCKWVFL